MEKAGQAHKLALFPVIAKLHRHLIRHMHDTKGMDEPRVLGAGKNPVGEAELLDALEPFKNRELDELLFHLGELDEAVDVVKNLVGKNKPVFSHVSLPR